MAAAGAALLGAVFAGMGTGRGDRLGAVPRCASGASDDLLSHEALQCWFDEDGDAWRILSAISAHHALVARIEVLEPDAAPRVATRFIEKVRSGFGEVLVYVHAAPHAATRRVHRVRWTRQEGYSTLTFEAPSPAFQP